MAITYDPAKRELTLLHCGLDFEDAPRIFESDTLTVEDDRKDYGETRWQTFGLLDNRLVTLIWVKRDHARPRTS